MKSFFQAVRKWMGAKQFLERTISTSAGMVHVPTAVQGKTIS